MLNRFAENWTNFFAESIAICTKIVYIIMGRKLRIYSAFCFFVQFPLPQILQLPGGFRLAQTPRIEYNSHRTARQEELHSIMYKVRLGVFLYVHRQREV